MSQDHAICRTCRKPIERREVSPGTWRWGHVSNPTFQHHYAVPRAEKREEAK